MDQSEIVRENEISDVSEESGRSLAELATDRLLDQLARGVETRLEARRRLLSSGFVHVADSGEYHWKDKLAEGKPSVAFKDHGKKLVTEGSEEMVVQGMLAAAEAKGWTSLAVNGSEEFRRAVWIAAETQGMKVSGYEPSPADLALVHDARVRAGLAHGAAPEAAARRSASEVVDYAKSAEFAQTVQHTTERLRTVGYEVEQPGFMVGMKRELLSRHAAGHDVRIGTQERPGPREEPAAAVPTEGVEGKARMRAR